MNPHSVKRNLLAIGASKRQKLSQVVAQSVAVGRVIGWVVLVGFAVLANATALATGLQCEELFAEPTILPESFVKLSQEELNAKNLRPSVKAREKIDSKLGKLFIFELMGLRWYSSYAPVKNNPQGDPRWFPALVGAKVAAQFRFLKISENKMTAPTAEVASHVVDDFNKVLKDAEKLNFKFVETGEAALDGREYLLYFLKRILPIASLGHYAVHDISFHLAAILFPDNVLREADRSIELLLKFADWVDALKEVDPHQKKLLQVIAKYLINQKVSDIDFGTGNLGFLFVAKEFAGGSQSEAFKEKVQDHILSNLFANGKSALEDTRDGVYGFLKQALAEAPTAKIKGDATKALTLAQSFFNQVKEPEFNTRASIDTAQFINDVEVKIQALQRNAESIQGPE
jgi:hypothetical protein